MAKVFPFRELNLTRLLRIATWALSIAVVVASTAVGAQSPASLLVLSKKDHTVSIIDPVTLKIVGTAPVGDDPHEVVASADGKTAYISNYGGGQFHTISVVDLTSPKRLDSIDLGALNGPHGLDFEGGKVWFTA